MNDIAFSLKPSLPYSLQNQDSFVNELALVYLYQGNDIKIHFITK